MLCMLWGLTGTVRGQGRGVDARLHDDVLHGGVWQTQAPLPTASLFPLPLAAPPHPSPPTPPPSTSLACLLLTPHAHPLSAPVNRGCLGAALLAHHRLSRARKPIAGQKSDVYAHRYLAWREQLRPTWRRALRHPGCLSCRQLRPFFLPTRWNPPSLPTASAYPTHKLSYTQVWAPSCAAPLPLAPRCQT